MKRTMLLSLLLPLLFACAEEQSGTKIVINAQNYGAEAINLVWRTPDGEMKREPLTLENGSASIEIEIPEATQINLVSQDPRSRITMERGIIPGPGFTFYAENGKITISFDGDKWPELTIKGGKLNSDMNRYWKEMGPLEAKGFEATRRRVAGDDQEGSEGIENIQKEQLRVMKMFIDNNPNSALSLDLLSRIYLSFELNEIEAQFNKLGTNVKASEKGVSLAQKIERDKSSLPGNPAPQFTKKDKDGNNVSLSNFAGKYLLIDFWGTWCGPCRQSHPHLVALYQKYSPMGLAFLNVAQEGNSDPRPGWLKAIEEDGLVWTQILNDEGKGECDVVTLFSISAFPSKILIDPQGVIVAKWIGDTPEVDEKLLEIFGV